MPPLVPRSRRAIVAACALSLGFAGVVIVGISGNHHPELSQAVDPKAAEPGVAVAESDGGLAVSTGGPSDDELRRAIVGTWEDDHQGHRTLVLREDGTGTMVVELSGLKAQLFASRLEFVMQWSVSGGRFQERCVGGQPATQVNLILKSVGDRADQPILELTGERLLLLDKDGTTRYDWRRMH